MRFLPVLLASATALIGATACSDAVANEAGAYVEVTPNSLAPGSVVSIRASCVDNSKPATVMSIAFGKIALQPGDGVLNGQALVPPDKEKGSYDVRLSCPSGSSANTTLIVLDTDPTADSTVQPTRAPVTLGPNTGGGFLANGGSGQPADRSPLLWLGIGAASLIAAAALTARSKLRRPRDGVASAGHR
jgi:hypothetical protein